MIDLIACKDNQAVYVELSYEGAEFASFTVFLIAQIPIDDWPELEGTRLELPPSDLRGSESFQQQAVRFNPFCGEFGPGD